MVTLNNVTDTIRVRELCSWTPNFVVSNDESVEEESIRKYDKKRNESIEENDFAGTMNDAEIDNFMQDQELGDEVQVNKPCDSPTPDKLYEKPNDSDPFELDHLIKKSGKAHKPCQSETPEYLLGFSLRGDHEVLDSIQKLTDGGHIKQPSYSVLDRLEETIKVGLALGLNMEGCKKTLATLIAEKGEKETKMLQVDLWMLRQIWGNVHFDFASTSAHAVFKLGGLWCMLLKIYQAKSLFEGETYGLIFCDQQARIFNDFITESSLIYISLGGFNFTWMNKWGTKMSKLVRFLVFESFYETFAQATSLVLEKGILDHRPILLKESIVDYGPTPFRFFHSWLEMDGFHELVSQTWKNDGIVDVNGFTLFKKKLQNLKKVIRCGFLLTRRDSLIVLGNMDRIEAQDYAQKAKIKWALEGDENTKEFLVHFRNRFKQPFSSPSSLDSLSFNSLSQIHRDYLELPFSRDEIKRGVCLIGCQYKIIGKLLANRLSNVIGDCISPVQSAFIKEKMGFGIKWRSWISGCLHNARSSVLVNSSLTKEFELFRGLGQRDPQSPFLFILTMEGLHSLTCKAEEIGLFKGLKINVDKSNVLGLGISPEEVAQMASIIARLLSVGGCLSLMKAVLGVDLNENRMSWVKWERCMVSKKKGGLGIGSIYGLNIGLLFKWIWRFLTPLSDLWARVIGNIYDHIGGIFNDYMRQNKQTTWGSILSSINRLKEKGIDILSFCTRKLGNGESTHFWEDIWFGSTPLRLQFPRIYLLDTDRNCPIANRIPLLHFDWSTVLTRSPRGGVDFA
nr:RNA-directed DNA polymerase, eukaryota, reverse transcriptase zinc-binding domain protein [Tanacetum cinerariifolium]